MSTAVHRSLQWLSSLRLPRRTVRLRLTLVYGAVFLVCGVALLAMTYVLVAHATDNGVYRDGDTSIVVDGGHDPSAPAATQNYDDGTNRGTVPTAAPLLSPEQALRLARQQHADLLHQLLLQSGLALLCTAVIAIGLGWLVAGRILRPVRTITGTVREISETNLHRRLELAGPKDELAELGDTFDALLARLDASFQAQRRFVANASHELRTPLARARTVGQVAISDPAATVESLRSAHERVLAAGAQQERTIEALLALARGQAGTERCDAIDLAALTAQVVATRHAEALARDVDLHLTSSSTTLTAGDARLIERLIANLVENGLRHNLAGGFVEIDTSPRGDRAVLTVSNTGPVVADDAVQLLFEPFRRLGGDRVGDGLGLGLSIVQAIAEAHHAMIAVLSRPGGGLIVEVSFAARDQSPAGIQPTTPTAVTGIARVSR
jgi:signal transduction histidine kinase